MDKMRTIHISIFALVKSGVFVCGLQTLTYAQRLAIPNDKALEIRFCDLLANPERFDKKLVKVRAIYVSGFEASYFYDPPCEKDPGNNHIFGLFPDSFENLATFAESRKLKRILSSKSKTGNQNLRYSTYSRRAEITIVARFDGKPLGTRITKRGTETQDGYGPLGYQTQLVVKRFEKVREVGGAEPW